MFGLRDAMSLNEVVRIIPTASFYVSTWNLFRHIDSLCIRHLTDESGFDLMLFSGTDNAFVVLSN